MLMELEDASLYYELHGEGRETILLLHGNCEDHTYFKQQIPFLVALGLQVLLMDMRGHGVSTLGKKPLDFHLFAHDVIALLDQLNTDKVHLLGFSDGANTAMQVACSYPERVNSLILNGGNLNSKGIKPFVQTGIVLGYACLCLFVPFSKKAKQKQQVMGLMIHHPHLSEDDLAKIDVATLVIAGENDMVRTSHTNFIADHLQHASLCILPKGDHFIAMKQPLAFNQAIATFLRGVING